MEFILLDRMRFNSRAPLALMLASALVAAASSGCQPKADDDEPDASGASGSSGGKAGRGGSGDGGSRDGGSRDSGSRDSGSGDRDASSDENTDSGTRSDAAIDAGTDAGGDGGIDPNDPFGTTGGPYVAPKGPLQVTVTALTHPAVPTGRLLYEITVSNVTSRAVENIRVLLRVPAGLQFSYSEDAQPNSSGCGNGVCSADEEATWTLSSLAAGTSLDIVINAQVLDSVGDGDSIAAMLSVTATGVEQINLGKTVSVYSRPSAQLALALAENPLTAGQTIALEIDVGQIGAAALRGAKLRAEVPPGIDLGAIAGGGTMVAPGTVEWSLGDVAVGKSLRRSVQLTVQSAVIAGAVLPIRSQLSHEGGPEIDATSELPIRVIAARVPLETDVSLALSSVIPGGRLLYTTTVSNLSAREIENVAVLVRVPVGLELSYSGDTVPNSSGCGNGVCSAHEEVVWDLGTLAAGTSRTIALNPTIVATDVGDGSLIAMRTLVTSSVGSNEVTKIVHTQTHPAAQLSLRAAKDPVVAGSAFTLELDVGQVGAQALSAVALELLLPQGVTAGAISDGGTEATPGRVSWSVGNVAVGGTLHRSVELTVAAAVAPATVLAARATLTHEGGPAIGFQSEHGVTVVAAPLPLELEVTTAPDKATPNARLLYTVTVRNVASRAVDGIALWTRLPPGLEFSYNGDAEPDSSGCGNGVCSAHEEATWELATLAAGTAQTFTVNAQVLATLPEGNLVSTPFYLTAAGVAQGIQVWKTVPTHP